MDSKETAPPASKSNGLETSQNQDNHTEFQNKSTTVLLQANQSKTEVEVSASKSLSMQSVHKSAPKLNSDFSKDKQIIKATNKNSNTADLTAKLNKASKLNVQALEFIEYQKEVIEEKEAEIKKLRYEKNKELAEIRYEKYEKLAELSYEKNKEIAEIRYEKNKEIAEIRYEKNKEIVEKVSSLLSLCSEINLNPNETHFDPNKYAISVESAKKDLSTNEN